METFSVKFRAGNLNLNAIVTEHDHHEKFKVEFVTKESNPILLMRSHRGEWSVMQPGSRNFSNSDFEELQLAIEAELNEMYSAKRILVLTDFSEEASNAAVYAAGLAHQLNTRKVLLYHSYQSISLNASSFAPISGLPSDSYDLSVDQITRLKNELEEWGLGDTEIEVRTDERNLIYAVNALVQQFRIGLVVAGITGKTGLERALIGSNTLKLAKDCSVPLLIVPGVANFKQIETVVFACDLKRVYITTPILAIKTFLKTLGAKLLILNIDTEEQYQYSDTPEGLSQLHELWDDLETEYHYINHEDTAQGIMDFANQQGAELVITVPKQYGFFESLFHRSTTQKLTYHSYLPLLLFKEDL